MYFWYHPEWPPEPVPRRERAPEARAIAEHWRAADERLADCLALRLLHSDEVTDGHIDLSVQNGVVILDGTVGSDDVRAAAVAVAWAEPGVQDVCDKLTVTRAPGRR